MARLPRGIRNNNPLNIKKGNNWIGERANQKDKDFEEFETMQMGIRAALKLIRNYIILGYNTPRKIIHRWAPPIENYPENYANLVWRHTNLRLDGVLRPDNKEDITLLAWGMSFVENGTDLPVQDFVAAAKLINW